MNGVWLEDGSFEAAKGEVKRMKGKMKGKGKGKKGKGKGKGKGEDEPDAKRARLDEPEEPQDESAEIDFDWEWQDRQVCLINLKAAGLNGTIGHVRKYMGSEEILVEGKKKKIRRLLVELEAGKGEKSIKMDNLFKVDTGALVKLRGLDSAELNDSVAECGRLDPVAMRYDVTLSDGRHIKVKPSNVEFVAKYEASQVAGDKDQVDWLRSASSLKDKVAAVEEFSYPIPQILPATALTEYAKKFPKAVVIGRSNAANPKGAQVLAREVVTATLAAPNARLIFVSMPRDRCVFPALEQMRHDELLRLGKFAEWVSRRCAPRPVYFLLPGIAVKGPATVIAAGACAWPLYAELCHDMVVLESERWHKSPWARLDSLLAVWARKPLYGLPEKYSPPIELGNASGQTAEDGKEEPLTFKPEEPFTIERPTTNASNAPAVLASLTDRAAEAEGGSAGVAKVAKPTLAIRRL